MAKNRDIPGYLWYRPDEDRAEVVRKSLVAKVIDKGMVEVRSSTNDIVVVLKKGAIIDQLFSGLKIVPIHGAVLSPATNTCRDELGQETRKQLVAWLLAVSMPKRATKVFAVMLYLLSGCEQLEISGPNLARLFGLSDSYSREIIMSWQGLVSLPGRGHRFLIDKTHPLLRQADTSSYGKILF